MLKITFKNVGQGDSIIIEWKYNDEMQIGIIDCNLFDSRNPVVDYLKHLKPTIISFIILSHPHEDHFSGMKDLLLYCESQNIVIQRFIHTAFSTKEFLKASARKNTPQSKELEQLFRLLSSFTKNKAIKDSFFLGGDVRKVEFEGLNLCFLAPTISEYNDFNASLYKDRDDNKVNNPNANLLSTVIKIEYKQKFVLLTSDATSQTFKRIYQDCQDYLQGILSIMQIPHHGSSTNHFKPLWEKIIHGNSCPAIISVGENIYKLPSKDVINSFKKMSYEIHSTNPIGFLQELMSAKSIMKTDMLDLISEITYRKPTKNQLLGDQIFQL